MLTEQERSLIERTFAGGPGVLLEEGYTGEALASFLVRPDVQEHFSLLQRELDHSDALAVRSRFLARRDLTRLSKLAVAVIGQALAGPQYLYGKNEKGETVISRDANGSPILQRPEITERQIRSAELVMDSLGIQFQRAKNDVGSLGNADVATLFKPTETTITVQDDPTHEKESQRALSRERVRTAIAILAKKVPSLHASLHSDSSAIPKRKVRRGSKKTKAP